MAWRKKSEGLDLNCTAKGSHVGSGGRVAHFFVAIAYNKGTILCEQYFGNINGDMFAQFVKDHFNETFKKSDNGEGKLFLQDGDPSQNSKKAKYALLFHITKQKLHADALSRNIVLKISMSIQSV